MTTLLSGITALYKNLPRLVFQRPTVMAGVAPDDTVVLLNTDADGNLLISLQSAEATPAFIAFAATSAFASLTSTPGRYADIFNNTGVDMTLDHGNATAAFILPTGTGKVFHLAANASELRLKVASGTPTISIEVW